jgi:zinc protease
LKREALSQFYRTHYIPNNATLVIVGNLNPDEVYRCVKMEFGGLKGNPDYKKSVFYH